MSDQEQNNNDDLNEFLRVNKLPCFSQVKIIDETGIDYGKEQLYFYRQFEANCIFAKCYSNILQTYLLHQRPSYVPSESELTLTINNQASNIQYLFSDIVSIPINYTGLFEIFSSNSTKTDGVLDHEKDVASLISRLHKPKLYYVAKEMKVYEMSPFKMGDDTTNMSRKWITIPKGSIVKLIRVVSIDYEDTSNSIGTILKKIFCCNPVLIKTDMAIELKILDNFEDVQRIKDLDSEQSNLSRKFDTHARLSRANIQVKACFLPVYEKTGSNEEIDLIPISSIVKNQKIKINSLQLAKNFASDNVKTDFIELKLFEEDAFKPTKFSHQNISGVEMLQDNQHLELEKYMSIYDLVEYRPRCKIIVAYSFSKESLVFIPVEPVDIGLNKKCVYSLLDDKMTKQIENFNLSLKDKFIQVVENELEIFDDHINKMETFAFKKKNFEGLKMNEIEKFLVKPKGKEDLLFQHFADFENVDNSVFKFDDDLIKESSESETSKAKTDRSKYNTLPHNHSSQMLKDETDDSNENEDKMDELKQQQQSPDFVHIHNKRSSRSYSLPVDKALIIKKYMSSKIQDMS